MAMSVAVIAIEAMIAACFVGIACCAWACVCNERTYRQRGVMIKALTLDARRRIANNDSVGYLNNFYLFLTTSYGQHLWLLFSFRDPQTMYPQQLRELLFSERSSSTEDQQEARTAAKAKGCRSQATGEQS